MIIYELNFFKAIKYSICDLFDDFTSSICCCKFWNNSNSNSNFNSNLQKKEKID